MKRLRDAPIKSKLKLLLGLTSGIALAITSTAFILNDIRLIRSHASRTLNVAANALRPSAAAALEADNPAASTEALRTLIAQQMIEGACLYDARGRIFASYNGRSGGDEWVPAPRKDGQYTDGNSIELYQSVRRGGTVLGTLLIRAHTREIYSQIRRSVIIVAGAIIGSFAASILLSSRLRELISRPILRLAEALRSVPHHKTFAVRVQKESNDELGVLSDGFNNMMDELQKREEEIRRRRLESLEARHLTIFALAKLAGKRSLETGVHLERIRTYTRILARQLSSSGQMADVVTPRFIEMVYLTSPLHDIGKVGIPDSILLKPGPLSADEFEVMKRHTTIGADAIQAALEKYPQVEYLQIARDIALTHHERFDGTGYPRGLAGEDIPTCGRMIALADVYDALTCHRVYKQALSPQEARDIIVRERGKALDPRVVQAFLQVEDEFLSAHLHFADDAAEGAETQAPSEQNSSIIVVGSE